MVVLNWRFSNDHAWSKMFSTVDDAVKYVEVCGMYSHHGIDRVWVDADDGQVWLKEKSN